MKVFKYYLTYEGFGIRSQVYDDLCDRFNDQLKLMMFLGNAALLSIL